MSLPEIRRYTVNTGTDGVPTSMTDPKTGETQFLITRPNRIMDVVQSVGPASGALVEYRIYKQGNETPVSWWSNAILPTTSGRMAIGPIDIGPGQYIIKAITRGSTDPGDVEIQVKWAAPLM